MSKTYSYNPGMLALAMGILTMDGINGFDESYFELEPPKSFKLLDDELLQLLIDDYKVNGESLSAGSTGTAGKFVHFVYEAVVYEAGDYSWTK